MSEGSFSRDAGHILVCPQIALIADIAKSRPILTSYILITASGTDLQGERSKGARAPLAGLKEFLFF